MTTMLKAVWPVRPPSLLFLLLMVFAAGPALLRAQEVTTDRNFIRIDQFGYLPQATKVAVLARAVNGYNADAGLLINPGVPVELVAEDGTVAFTAYPKLWNGGSTDALSGDRGAWFDFTTFQTPGTYRIRVTQLDGSQVESYDFRIDDEVYHDVLRAGLNFFYYQRINQEKTAEHASGAPWTDAAWYSRPNQEVAVKQLDNPSNTRDLSGGWFDAGDPNKYVTFAVDAVHNLLTTYDNAPEFFNTFELNIPESGDDKPDLLDEVKFEIDWIKKMQYYVPGARSGGIIQKMGILNDVNYISPPSTDRRERWFNQVCVSSSITGAGMLAHAALSYRRAGVWPEEVAELTERAVQAWNYYEDAPNKDERCDDGRIEAGDADGPGDQYATEHLALATAAAVYLFELTGDQKYNAFVAANYRRTRPWNAEDWGVYRAHQGEALLTYTRNPNADAATRTAVLNLKSSGAKSEGSNYLLAGSDNLYRAKPIYFNWGSNSLISRQVGDIMDLFLFGIKPANHPAYTERGQSIINYLHGTNPSGTCFLSNMYQYGAELCADEMWHSWFAANTPFDNLGGNNIGPAPGFISGGPNPQGQANMVIKLGTHVFTGATAGQQPSQKAFSVDNNWRYGPWAYNEPAIYYQAAYVKALSYFVAGNTPAGETGNGIAFTNDCQDASSNFAITNDTGNNGAVAGATNVEGATGGETVLLPDANDAATFTFRVPARGRYDVAVRVRVGAAGADRQGLADKYTLNLNGNNQEYVLDASSVATATGDSYFGEIVIVDAPLGSGEQRLRITANDDNLSVDQVCFRNPNSVTVQPDGTETVCQEAEAGFMAIADVGSNSTIGIDDFTPGSSGNSYINLFDDGDRVSLLFTTTNAGKTELRFRLRVGEATGTDRNLADKYIITVNGEAVSTTLDPSTISAIQDDTYWGEIVATDVDLTAGEHVVTVEADRDWLKFDRLCFKTSTTGLFPVSPTLSADLEVFPNPNTGVFQLRYQLEQSVSALTAKLYDINGRLVAQQAISSVGLTGQVAFTPKTKIVPGVYLLRLSAAEGQVGGLQRVVVR